MPVSEVGAFESKTHLPQLLKRVQRGERFVITRHKHPVAAPARGVRHSIWLTRTRSPSTTRCTWSWPCGGDRRRLDEDLRATVRADRRLLLLGSRHRDLPTSACRLIQPRIPRKERVGISSLPPVFPVALCNGRHPRTAEEDVSDLLAPVGTELAPFQPSQRYSVLDTSHGTGLQPSSPEHENLVAALVRLESGRDPEEVVAALDALRRRLSGPRYEDLKRAFREWARQVDLPEKVLARVREATGVNDPQEGEKLLVAMTLGAFADHLAGGHVEGGE